MRNKIIFGLVLLLCLSFVSAVTFELTAKNIFNTTSIQSFAANISNLTLTESPEPDAFGQLGGLPEWSNSGNAFNGAWTGAGATCGGSTCAVLYNRTIPSGVTAANYTLRFFIDGPQAGSPQYKFYCLPDGGDILIRTISNEGGTSGTNFSDKIPSGCLIDSENKLRLYVRFNLNGGSDTGTFTEESIFWHNFTNPETFSTTNGTILFPQNQIVRLFLFNFTSNTFFNQSRTPINTSVNLEVDTYQSILVVNAREKITNLSLSVFNMTVTGSGGSQTNNSNSSGNTTLLLDVDDYNISGFAEDFSFIDFANFTTLSLTTSTTEVFFSPNQLNITARDNITNATINTFTISVFLNGSFIENQSTSTGSILFNGINGSYDITISSDTFASTTESINFTNTTQNHTFFLFQANSIFINIFNQTDGGRIFAPVVISFILGDIQVQNTTTTSSFFVGNLTIGNYTVSFESVNYTKVSYAVSVTEGSNQTLNAYLPHISISGEVVFEILDSSTGSVIEDVSFAISRFVGDSLTLFLTLISDVTGRVGFNFEQDTEYSFVLIKDGFVTKSFILNPILFNTYTVRMDRTTGQENTVSYSEVNVIYDPKQFTDGVNHNITIQFISPGGFFDTYGFNITWKDTVLSGNGINANGQIFTTNLSVSDADFDEFVTLTYFYKTTFGEDTKVFIVPINVITFGTGNNTLMGNRGQTYGLGILERATFATFWAILLGGAAAQVSGASGGAMAGIFVFGLFAYLGWLEFWVAIIPILILFIILAWGRN